MGVLDKHEKTFTDIPGKTSIIEQRVHLVDDSPIRCRPYALSYAVREEIQEEIQEMINIRRFAACFANGCSKEGHI